MTVPPTQTPSPAGHDRETPGSRAANSWLLPAVTFLIGLALGALLLWVTRPATSPEEALPVGATPSASSGQLSTTGGGDGGTAPGAAGSIAPTVPAPTVTVPASCAQLARDVGSATSLLDAAASAARDVDAARLADIVRRMGEVRTTLDAEANACLDVAARASVSVPPPSTSAS